MRALTVRPGVRGSMQLQELPEPDPSIGAVLIETQWLGVCGTDRELAEGLYGSPPPGEERIVVGHEVVGHVIDAPRGCGLVRGDWAVGIVRHPDPAPCPECALGEPDRCSNGGFSECGIHRRHGFGSDRFRIAPELAIRVPNVLGVLGVLVEPASVVAKAWEQVDQLLAGRVRRSPRVLVLGAGPVGLLAALFASQRELDVHVVDRVRGGPKRRLVEALGATYHARIGDWVRRPWDVVFECTGSPELLLDAIGWAGPNGLVCLMGMVGSRGTSRSLGAIAREWVLENNIVFGSVSANRRHYRRAIGDLVQAERGWLAGLITRCVPIEQWQLAMEDLSMQVKCVLNFAR